MNVLSSECRRLCPDQCASRAMPLGPPSPIALSDLSHTGIPIRLAPSEMATNATKPPDPDVSEYSAAGGPNRTPTNVICVIRPLVAPRVCNEGATRGSNAQSPTSMPQPNMNVQF